jgi:valyl-tRNA synthetase
VAGNFDAQVDELYQRPLAEFTSARNALAKTLSGDSRRIVASLAKPSVPLWAINQLYWKDPSTYKALIDAAEKLRTAHRAVIGGKKVDLRKPDEVHRAALERAAAKTVSLLERAAGTVSEPARTAIRRTLATLPADEQPGRLTREPEPAGFSMFAGVTPRAGRIAPPAPAGRNDKPQNAKRNQRNEANERRAAQQEQQQAERARQRAERERAKAVAKARTEMKDAQQAAERATFALRKAEAEVAKARTVETEAANRLKEIEGRLAELLKA